MDKITHKVRCEQWTSIIKECLASGMPKTTWCREHGISDKSFFLLATNSPRRSIPYYIREHLSACCQRESSSNNYRFHRNQND